MALDFLGHLRSESQRFAEVLARIDPGAPVPSCPEWNAADLLWHLAEVQLFWATVVDRRLNSPGDVQVRERPDDPDSLLGVFCAANAYLVESLAAAPDDTPVWTWFGSDQTVGFVRRRQPHEALIHRLDAELAAGAVTDFDPALATDGVAEVLECMYSEPPPWAEHDLGGPVGRVVADDTGAQWLVRLGSWSGTSPKSGKTYRDRPTLTVVPSGEPAFQLSGAARDLDAWLWNRPSWDEVRLDGDGAAFAALIRSGVQ